MAILSNVLKSIVSSHLGEAFLESRINDYLKDMGRVSNFKLDLFRKTCTFECYLIGEPGPISVSLVDIDLISEGQEEYLVFNNVLTSREWMNVFFAKFLKSKRIALPDAMKNGLTRLVFH